MIQLNDKEFRWSTQAWYAKKNVLHLDHYSRGAAGDKWDRKRGGGKNIVVKEKGGKKGDWEPNEYI